MTKFLSCTNMTGGYGGEDIIHGCDIEVDRNQIVVIVGPNGAGKSTACLLYTSPSPRDLSTSRMPSSA